MLDVCTCYEGTRAIIDDTIATTLNMLYMYVGKCADAVHAHAVDDDSTSPSKRPCVTARKITGKKIKLYSAEEEKKSQAKI